MNINSKDFCVKEGEKVDLTKRPTITTPFYKSKEEYQELMASQRKDLCALQTILYAYNRYSILLVFQGMDTAGKDGAIKNVMSGVRPQGCEVFSFKQPSAKELEHDFLWRTNQNLPERGRIGIFNRSYYEEVLIVRVHPQILKNQGIPDALLRKNIWQERYCSIRDLEKHLHHNGTRIIKVFLHLSKEEQRLRFIQRIDDPQKNWKIGPTDLKERKYWKDYMKAYEDCLSATSTDLAPWYIVPADDKKNSSLIIHKILGETLKDLKMSYPKLDAKRKKELKSMRKLLTNKNNE